MQVRSGTAKPTDTTVLDSMGVKGARRRGSRQRQISRRRFGSHEESFKGGHRPHPSLRGGPDAIFPGMGVISGADVDPLNVGFAEMHCSDTQAGGSVEIKLLAGPGKHEASPFKTATLR